MWTEGMPETDFRTSGFSWFNYNYFGEKCLITNNFNIWSHTFKSDFDTIKSIVEWLMFVLKSDFKIIQGEEKERKKRGKIEEKVGKRGAKSLEREKVEERKI